MITKKVMQLRADARAADRDPFHVFSLEESRQIMDEIIDNCEPTADEFEAMTRGITITGYDLYRIIPKFSHPKGGHVKETIIAIATSAVIAALIIVGVIFRLFELGLIK
jgi:hypothetical protein